MSQAQSHCPYLVETLDNKTPELYFFLCSRMHIPHILCTIISCTLVHSPAVISPTVALFVGLIKLLILCLVTSHIALTTNIDNLNHRFNFDTSSLHCAVSLHPDSFNECCTFLLFLLPAAPPLRCVHHWLPGQYIWTIWAPRGITHAYETPAPLRGLRPHMPCPAT